MISDGYTIGSFLVYLAITTIYGLYMKRQGIMQGINETLITISRSDSEILQDALKELNAKAEAHFRDK